MKAPSATELSYLAPCGINCLACSRHLDTKRPPCGGCLRGGSVTSTHCQSCRIKLCAFEQGLSGCFECEKLPCARIKTLEKRYREHYGYLILESCRLARQEGVEALLRRQLEQYTCPDCGGLIDLHYGVCSECKKQYSLGKERSAPDAE
ncbi:MAG TPA: DUF3795 domain-containing protein [Feifaniaceae bacterium]|nr:DUF3795 domain-containing protein [Feifaniaceae bacterium]